MPPVQAPRPPVMRWPDGSPAGPGRQHRPEGQHRHRPDGSPAGPGRPHRPEAQNRPEGRGHANLPYLIVLAGGFGGLLWVWRSHMHVKGGMLVFAAALLLGGGARLVLTDERAGLLVSRRRGVDVAAFAILGFGLLVSALLLKNPS